MRFEFADTPGLLALRGENGCLACNPAEMENVYTVYHVSEDRLEEISGSSPRLRCTKEETAENCVWRVDIDGLISVSVRMETKENELTLR